MLYWLGPTLRFAVPKVVNRSVALRLSLKTIQTRNHGYSNIACPASSTGRASHANIP